ncbi:MAG: membrane protein [Chloroflexota bacterium]
MTVFACNTAVSRYSSRMIKPIRWSSFVRDFIVIQIGFAVFALSIALLIQANLGTSPWVMLTVALSDIIGWSVGTLTILIGFVVLAGSLYFKEQIGWGTLGNILCIGPWLDGALLLVPSVTGNWPIQLLMLFASALLMGMATAVYIGVDAGAGPRDTLMLAVTRNSRLSLRQARATIELIVLLFGVLLGGPVGWGTVIFALIIGPAVQWGFRLFGVEAKKG